MTLARRGTPKVQPLKPAEERAPKPTDSDTWVSEVANHARAVMRTARLSAGVTFQALSDGCAEAGLRIHPVVLSKIEQGFRPSMTVPEMLAIASALGIEPSDMLPPPRKPDPDWIHKIVLTRG